MAEMFFDRPVTQAMGAGLRVPSARFGDDPATRMGVGGLQPTDADALVSGRTVAPQAPQALTTMGAVRSANAARAASLFAGPTLGAVAPAAERPPATAYFNQATNEMFAGDRAFKADDTSAAMEAARAPGNTTRPQGQGWVALPENAFGQYLASFGERRGKLELLGRGVKGLAYGLGTLPGTAASLLGFEEAGAAMRAPVEALLGDSEDEQLRSALIAESSSLWEQIIDGSVESVPLLLGSLAGGAGAAAWAARAGKAVSTVARAGVAGAAGANFPVHLSGMYDAAVRNGADLKDPLVKIGILGGALANSYLDTFGIESRLLSPVVKAAAENAAKGAVRRRLTSGALTGLAEAGTEVAQTFLESVLFDPVVHDNLSPQDWKVLAPHIAAQYGEQMLVAAGAGAILGGGVGVVLPQGAFAPKPPVPTDKPVDLSATATAQAAPPQVAPSDTGLGPVVPDLSPEGARLAADWQSNAVLGPAVPALGESEQTLADQWQSSLGPLPLPPETRRVPGTSTSIPLPPLPVSPAATSPPATTPVPLTRAGRAAEKRAAVVTPVAPVTAAPAAPGAALLRPAAPVAPATAAPAVRGAALLRPATPVAPVPPGTAAPAAPGAALLRPAAPVAPVTAAPVAPVTAAPIAPVTAAPGAALLRPATPVAPVTTTPVPLTKKDKAAAKKAAAAALASAPITPVPPAEALVDASYPQAAKLPAIRQFLVSYTESGSGDLRGLGDTIADYADWLGARTDTEWLAIGAAFSEADNPYLNASVLRDPAQLAPRFRKFSTLISPPPATPGKDAVQRRGKAEVGGKGGKGAKSGALKAKGDTGQTAPSAPAPPAITVGSVAAARGRARDAAGVPHQIVALSDGRVVRMRNTGTNFAQVWTFLKTGGTIGEGVKAEAAAARVAELASQGTLPNTVVDTEAEVTPEPGEKTAAEREADAVARGTEEAIADLEQDMMPAGAPMEGAKLDAAVDLMSIRDDPDTPEALRGLAQSVLEANSKTSGPAALSLAERAYAARAVAGRTGAQQATVQLTQVIDDFNAAPGDFTAEWQTYFRRLAAEVRKADPAARYGDRSLLSYVKSNNDPNFARVNGVRQIVGAPAVARGTEEAIADLEQDMMPAGAPMEGAKLDAAVDLMSIRDDPDTPEALRGLAQSVLEANSKTSGPAALSLAERAYAARAVAGRTGAPGGFSLADWNTIEGVVDLDGKPITAMAPGRVQLVVRTFLGKLARAPKVTVARNQADLRTKDPALHARAVAARPQGDFDIVQAMGYSFGDGQVIIFTDRIATEQQLNFVLAHEALGHYGLRALMPAGKFDALMEAAYNLDERIARAADAAMAVRPNLSKAEAVEEYLSDYAAALDTSLVARVWAAIKGFLNKLGVRHGDEMTRYLLDQSRRYVRYGTGVTFDAGAVGQRLHSVESSGDTGRFSVGKSLRDVNIEVGLTRDKLGVRPQSFSEAWGYIKARNINTIDSLDRFKANVLSLANYRARVNPGSAAFDDSLKRARDISMSLKTKYNEMMRVALSRAVYGELGGISDAQRSTVSGMLMAGLRRGAADYAKAEGNLGRTPLFLIEGDRLVRNAPEVERLQRNGTRTLEDMRDGFDYDVEFEEGGKTTKKRERFPGVSGLTEASVEWRSYASIRKAMDGIELELLEAHYRSLIDNRNLMFRKLADATTDRTLTADERAALITVAETYSTLYTTGVTVRDTGGADLDPDHQTYANDVLRMVNMALIGESTDRFTALRKLLTEPRVFSKDEEGTGRDRTLPAAMEGHLADDLIVKLKGFRQRLSLKGDKFAVQDKVKQIITAEIANQDADAYTKRTLFTGYVPILREGRFQMRVVALVGGRPVQVKDSYREQLVYSQFNSLSEAVEMSGKANEAFGDTPFEVMYYSDAAQGYVLGEVTLRAMPETALETVAGPPDLNLNEFLRGIRQFDINLSPQKLEQLIVALTRQNSAARNRLMRAFTPGADPDAIMAASRHIESRASTVAKIATRVRRSELMDRSMRSTNELWNAELTDPRTGRDWAEVLKERADAAAADPGASHDAKVDAQRMYEAYAHMVKETRGGPANRANQFYGEAAKTMEFVEGNKSVDESDFGAQPWVSAVRATTSMVQLGASVATGAMNFVALETNVVPYLASYNSKTAFGGGFGLGNVHREILRAATQVGGRSIVDGRFDTAEFFAEVEASDKLQKQFGLSAGEARFLKEGILDGKLTPAQTNSLIGTSRGRVTRGVTQKFIDGWMWTFNSFERASRQTAGLAAYRLEYARSLRAGKSAVGAHDRATQFSLQALDLTLGDYAVLNRPPAWRSGIQSFAYMYKVFVTTSVQLLANMDRKGQLFMLGSLWLLTGLQGLPFAEDLEDVIDTIAQTLKIPGWRGARYEAAQVLDNAFPGMSPVLMQGLVNQFVPGDVAAKTSLGDLLPGTGGLIAGADPWRAAMEIFGPAAGMIGATATFSKQALTAPFTATVDVADVLRESPVTMMRAAGEAYVYMQNGAVVDRRGYTVSPDMDAATILARVLGFYPVAASRQYEMIGMAKRITDYQREQTAAYRAGWVRAMMEGDRARAREIEAEVTTWNAGSKGTGLEIRNFVKNSQRALKEARRPAMERTLRAAPDAAERDLQNLIDLMSVN